MTLFTNKKILITGATGLVGSNLVEEFMKHENVSVVLLARDENKVRALFQKYFNRKNFTYHIQDIRLPFNFDDDFDYIFNAAGSISHNEIYKCPVHIIDTNVLGARNCLEYAKSHKCRVILFSSATIYASDEAADVQLDETQTNMTDCLDLPVCTYSQAKRMVETYARAYFNQFGTDIVIARLSYVYGFSKYVPDTALYEFVISALRGKDIVLKGKNYQRRDNIYIDDVIRLLLYISKYGQSGEAYNISSNLEGGNFAAIDEIARLIALNANIIKGTRIAVYGEYFNDKDRKKGIILDNSKLKSLSTENKLKITSLDSGIFNTLCKYNEYENSRNVW